MRILFYTEPHGLRDSFTAHMLPFDTFCTMAREINGSGADIFDGIEARVFANHFVATANFDKTYDDWPFILQPDVAEQQMIEDSARIWMGSGMQDWISLMTDEEAPITRAYVRLLHRIKKTEFDFDVIACWGENMAVRTAARDLGARIVFFELSSMRAPFPRSVLIDPKGVNGAASVTDMTIGDLRRVITPLPQELFTALINEEFASGQQSANLPTALYHPLSKSIRDFIGGGKRAALVPLQLADDANQLLYSSYDTVQSFVTAAVEPLLAAGFRVLLKPHPHARLRGGHVMNVQRQVMRLFQDREGVMVLPEKDIPGEYLPLLRAVDLVVTNNSSAGFEAMMLGTRVVVLGRACYVPRDGLPSLDTAIRCFDDPSVDQHFAENRRIITTYMLACAFPLQRRLGAELVKRVRQWNKDEEGKPHAWLDGLPAAIAWDTWHQRDFMRLATGVRS